MHCVFVYRKSFPPGPLLERDGCVRRCFEKFCKEVRVRGVESGCSRIHLRETGFEILVNGRVASDLGVEERRRDFEDNNAFLSVLFAMQGIRREGLLGGHGGDAR